MKVNVNSFSEKFQVAMGKFSTNIIVMTIANGMIKLLPITMVGSICAILSNLGIPGYQDFIDGAGITPIIKLGTTMTTNLISVYVLASLSIEMAKMLKSDIISAVLISFMSFFIVTPLGSFDIKDGKVSAFDISYLGSKGMFVAMIVALLCTYSYYFLTKKKITIKLPDNVPPTVATSFAALLPAMIIGAVAGFISFTSASQPFSSPNLRPFASLLIRWIVACVFSKSFMSKMVYLSRPFLVRKTGAPTVASFNTLLSFRKSEIGLILGISISLLLSLRISQSAVNSTENFTAIFFMRIG